MNKTDESPGGATEKNRLVHAFRRGPFLRERRQRFGRWAKNALGYVVAALLPVVRRTNLDLLADLSGWVMRRVGPCLGSHQIAKTNLIAAYPEKNAEDIKIILSGFWDNIGRMLVEYAHLDRLWKRNSESRIERIVDREDTVEKISRIRSTQRPVVFFSAHLANFDLACIPGPAEGLDVVMLFRRLNIEPLADALAKIRARGQGRFVPSQRARSRGDAQKPRANSFNPLIDALARGKHVAMMIDQHFGRGIDVTFFGRPCKANPLAARLARHFDCAIHGIRIIRVERNRFRVDITDALPVPRDTDGKIDVSRTMQELTNIVEGWIREHPEQWIWMHRRWR